MVSFGPGPWVPTTQCCLGRRTGDGHPARGKEVNTADRRTHQRTWAPAMTEQGIYNLLPSCGISRYIERIPRAWAGWRPRASDVTVEKVDACFLSPRAAEQHDARTGVAVFWSRAVSRAAVVPTPAVRIADDARARTFYQGEVEYDQGSMSHVLYLPRRPVGHEPARRGPGVFRRWGRFSRGEPVLADRGPARAGCGARCGCWDSLFATPGYAALAARERRRPTLVAGIRMALNPTLTVQRDSVLRIGPWTAHVIQHVRTLPGRRHELVVLQERLIREDFLSASLKLGQTLLPAGAARDFGSPSVSLCVLPARRSRLSQRDCG